MLNQIFEERYVLFAKDESACIRFNIHLVRVQPDVLDVQVFSLPQELNSFLDISTDVSMKISFVSCAEDADMNDLSGRVYVSQQNFALDDSKSENSLPDWRYSSLMIQGV